MFKGWRKLKIKHNKQIKLHNTLKIYLNRKETNNLDNPNNLYKYKGKTYQLKVFLLKIFLLSSLSHPHKLFLLPSKLQAASINKYRHNKVHYGDMDQPNNHIHNSSHKHKLNLICKDKYPKIKLKVEDKVKLKWVLDQHKMLERLWAHLLKVHFQDQRHKLPPLEYKSKEDQ